MCFSPYLGVGRGFGTGGRARKRHSLDRLVPLCRRSLQAGGTLRGRGGGGAELQDRPFPPAPPPLYIGTRTVKAQYPLYVFFTLFGCKGGGPKGAGAQPAHAVYTQLINTAHTALAAQKWSSLSPLRGALPKAIEFLKCVQGFMAGMVPSEKTWYMGVSCAKCLP